VALNLAAMFSTLASFCQEGFESIQHHAAFRDKPSLQNLTHVLGFQPIEGGLCEAPGQ
jgi:hypothetical protein